MYNIVMVMIFVSFSCPSEILGSSSDSVYWVRGSSDVSVVALFIDCSCGLDKDLNQWVFHPLLFILMSILLHI